MNQTRIDGKISNPYLVALLSIVDNDDFLVRRAQAQFLQNLVLHLFRLLLDLPVARN